jgi:hypothetical protein
MGGVESGKGATVIPVYVNTFNRLTTTRRLCEQIAALDNAFPIIVDNNSTWEPLIDWYCNCPFEVIRLTENMGHHAPWTAGIVGQQKQGLYCVTDCDLDLDGVPANLMEVLQAPFYWRRLPVVVKSGVALRIDDLPPWQTQVKEWESRFWKSRVGGDYYAAPIDTTLAMYRLLTPVRIATKVAGVRAVRAAGPCTARHMPWYLDPTNLDEENANYFATANSSNSWRPDGNQLTSRFLGKSK